MKKHITKITFILFYFAILVSCDSDSGLLSTFKTADIIPGVGAAGIKLGDYPEVVDEEINSPFTVGSGNGSRHWRIHAYEEEPYAGLQCWFINMDRYGIGPLDYIDIRSPFAGKTVEGIGIGTELSKVVELWGTPDFQRESSTYITHNYCFDDKKFRIVYKDSLIYLISLGPFLPYWLHSECFDEPNKTIIDFSGEL